jgi:hypothetical protein
VRRKRRRGPSSPSRPGHTLLSSRRLCVRRFTHPRTLTQTAPGLKPRSSPWPPNPQSVAVSLGPAELGRQSSLLVGEAEMEEKEAFWPKRTEAVGEGGVRGSSIQ